VRIKFIVLHIVIFLAAITVTRAQNTPAANGEGAIRGEIADPTGAVIPNATVTVSTSDGHPVATAKANGVGSYRAIHLGPGTYRVSASAQGFAPSAPKTVTLNPGQNQTVNITLLIQVQQQQVQVNSEDNSVDTSPENNANAIVIKGKDLDALSDDPDELSNELQALAGPAAGPNGGEIYIDGFTGGQIPPKSSIREIRINQNPFSAEFDRLGYGRIEIFTKPGTDKLHGQIQARGNDSVFNSQNPILNANLQPGELPVQEPSYHSYNLNGSVGGPINKSSSYFLSVFARNNQNESVIDATNPADTTETLNEAIANPSSRIDVSPRFDLQLGKSNTLTIRDEFYRALQSNAGLGALTLPVAAYDTHSLENTLQVSDSLVLSNTLVDDIRFQYRRIRNQELPISGLPTVTVQGDFTNGGSNSGTVEDHQDDYELQNYFAASKGAHSLNFGTRIRAYRDANYTNGGSNSAYVFDNIADYLAGTAKQYTITEIRNPVAKAILFDAALFYQDDWKINQGFTFSYGLRWEAQNRINDKDDWAPRLSLAYALGKQRGAQKPKTVLRAGYGWFYQRFSVPNSTSSTQGTPYIIQAIHNNFVPLGSSQVPNEEGFTIQNPDFYNPNQPVTTFSSSASAAAPTGYTLDPHFHAAVDMQGAVGIDRQLTKAITSNVTYLYSRGVHEYLTNNVSAAGIFPFANIQSDTYPAAAIAEPDENNMQFQSGGVYRQNQVIASLTARYSRFSIFSFYTYNNAKGDTSGVTYTPSVASDPGFDYGRSSFDIHDRFLLLGNINAPWQLSFAPFISANSGTPYNLTTGRDLTGNNQFNARPTYAADCGETNAVSTPYGCLDSDPLTTPGGASEKIVPFDLGTGPSNVSLNLRVTKVIGFGPMVGNRSSGGRGGGGGGRGGGGGLGGRGLSGNQGGAGGGPETTAHRYNLSFIAYGQNIFNHENLGTPNGTLTSSFFGKSQSLAGGFFGPSTAGNRSVFLAMNFSF
jgi:Carboxypeptidase regulatory-like domain